MALKLKPLHEQVIVITGASSGIGLVTARTAAARGAKVLLVARSEEALRTIVAEVEAAGGAAAYAVADVGEPDQVEAAAAAAIARFGRIDTWVNNAGTSIYAKLMDTPLEDHRQLFRTNYFGTVNGCVAALPHLRAQGGALITVGSIASEIPSPVMGAYAASKHAVRGYVRSLRIELQTDAPSVSVTLIKPSGIDTPIGQHSLNREGGEAQIPPPVYDPQIVADTILQCATFPRREITVGGAGRAQVLFGEHFPTAFEKLAPLMTKLLTDPDRAQPGPANLFAAARAGFARSGEHNPRTTSLYTTAQLNPMTSAAIVAGVAAAGAIAFIELLRPRPRAHPRG